MRPAASSSRGIALFLTATLLITTMSAIVQLLSDGVPLGEIIFFRCFVGMVPIAIYTMIRGQFPRALGTRKPLVHLQRAAIGVTAMGLNFYALSQLSLANAQALGYLAPVMALPLAGLLLGEAVGARHFAAIGLGFAGVGLMLWPAMSLPGNDATYGIIAGVAFAGTSAFVRVHIRGMTATESGPAIAFWFTVAGSVIGLMTLPLGWVVPDAGTMALLVLTGLLGGAAHIFSTEAQSRAQVSTLAIFEYSGLVWALAFDVVLLGAFPGPWSLAGAGAIVAAAMLSTLPAALRRRRERRAAKKMPRHPAEG
ncbi:DMT family transporter [Roseicyclus sp. F158]|uniref:DMT family transporter n=1 Tax=Tropicimonas omnivorans TaxID=3075590 RepID=A0ABU3DC05_9RHOB|nr:DMT family transporter [Roseicyclus sp. F158]MDT0681244.1 DMT family transporter [Roseicyclus sp. F158]